MLFAKTKGYKGTPPQHRILASDEEALDQFNFYTLPTIVGKVPFNPDRKLEPEEWYFITLSTEHVEKMIKPYVDNEHSSADLSNTLESDYETIQVVYKVMESRAIFTKITDSYRIKNRRLLKFKDLEQVKVIREHDSIEFSGEVHAYFNGNNKLYFRDFSKIRSLFSGIDEFYREATREEKERFLESDIFHRGEIDSSRIGQVDSKRIALVLNDQQLDFENAERQKKIVSSARQYSQEIGLEISDNDQIILDEPADVKKALNVILSKYYISEVTGEKMVSYGSASITKSEEGN